MIEKVSQDEIRAITNATIAGMSDHDRDEMAIPSYLHSNPLIRWLMWRRYVMIARYLKPREGGTALEFGCGLGLFLPELHRRFERVLAVDLFPDFAEALSAQRSLGTEFIANLGAVTDDSIDVLVAADVLEHIEDLPAYLDEFACKLKHDGRLIVSGPTENLIYRFGRVVAGFGGKGDYHHTNIERLIEAINNQGFVCKRTRRLPFAIPPTLFKICEFTKS